MLNKSNFYAEAVLFGGKVAFASRALCPVERADIEDRDDEAAIACAFAVIGSDAHEMPDTTACLDGLHDRLAICRDARQVLGDRRYERMRKLREQPAEIVVLESNLASHGRREPAHAQGVVEEDYGEVQDAKKALERVV